MTRHFIELADFPQAKRAKLLTDWQEGNLRQRVIPEPYFTHRNARQAVHKDNRKLMLICRNPYTLNLVCTIVAEGGALPKSRAGLFAGFAEFLLRREAKLAEKRGEPWPLDTPDRVKGALSRLADALQQNIEQSTTTIPKLAALAAIGQPDAELDFEHGAEKIGAE